MVRSVADLDLNWTMICCCPWYLLPNYLFIIGKRVLMLNSVAITLHMFFQTFTCVFSNFLQGIPLSRVAYATEALHCWLPTGSGRSKVMIVSSKKITISLNKIYGSAFLQLARQFFVSSLNILDIAQKLSNRKIWLNTDNCVRLDLLWRITNRILVCLRLSIWFLCCQYFLLFHSIKDYLLPL